EEGTEGAGDPRPSPGRLWAANTGCWLTIGALASAAGALAVAMQNLQPRESSERGAFLLPLAILDGGQHHVNVLAIVAVVLLYGFAVGQGVALGVRRPIPAFLVSATLALVLLLVWVPSLLCSPPNLWPLVVPALVLLATCW